jgi:hypothetical protein
MSWELGWRRASPEMNSPRRRFTGDRLTSCSGLGSGRRQALEVEHDMGNSSRHYRRREGARLGDPHDGVARGGGHAGVRAFRALQRPKCYGIRCNMTRGREWSSPRGCGAWSVAEDGRRRGPAEAMLGVIADGPRWGCFRSAGPSNRSARVLQRCSGGQHGQRPDDGEQLGWRRPLPTCVLGLIPVAADVPGPIAGLEKP